MKSNRQCDPYGVVLDISNLNLRVDEVDLRGLPAGCDSRPRAETSSSPEPLSPTTARPQFVGTTGLPFGCFDDTQLKEFKGSKEMSEVPNLPSTRVASKVGALERIVAGIGAELDLSQDEFSAQFQDFVQPCDVPEPRVSWEEASRLFMAQFNITMEMAVTIWKTVDLDGDMKLSESEYCQAAHTARKLGLTRPAFADQWDLGPHNHCSLVEPPATSSSLSSEPSELDTRNTSALDDSHDLLISPNSFAVNPTPDSTEPQTTAHSQFHPSPMSDISFSKLAVARASQAQSTVAANLPSLPMTSASGRIAFPPGGAPVEITNLSSSRSVEEANVWPPARQASLQSLDGLEEEDTDVEVLDDAYSSGDGEANACGVAALLPSARSAHREVLNRVNRAALLVHSHSSDTSSLSSLMNTSSSESWPAETQKPELVPFDNPPTSSVFQLPQTSTDSTSQRKANVLELLVNSTGMSRESLSSMSEDERHRLLSTVVHIARLTNNLLQRLNSELNTELQDVLQQHSSLIEQAHHLLLINPTLISSLRTNQTRPI